MSVILAIETSCDDTCASVMKNGKILTNVISRQEIHKKYGGVVPEMASRSHQQIIYEIVSKALKGANIEPEEITAIAFTAGPGLLGSLLVGISFAKGLSLSLNKPLIEVDHLMAHHLSHFIKDQKPEFPFLNLLVSGGHTQIALFHDFYDYEILGNTEDDAAGEALDKAAKILGLPYPGGPEIDRIANNGDPIAYKFPMPYAKGYNYSFSGLKTSLLYFIRDQLKVNSNFIDENLPSICASFQNTVVNYLLEKYEKVALDQGIKEIGISGGVAANSLLRKRLQKLGEEKNWKVYIPDISYCMDNAAMVANAANIKLLSKEYSGLGSVAYSR